MSRFVGKVAIVTGSSNGIGRATAVLLASEGAKVTITGRNAERLEETKQRIVKAGVSADNVNSVVGDVTSENIQNELVESTIKKFGKLDILVNNAGNVFNDPTGKVAVDQPIEYYDKTLALNLRSVVSLVQKSKQYLVATKGEIVNVSSIAGTPHAAENYMYYAMSKAALDQYTRSSAISLIPLGIRVNSVSPGVVETGIMEASGMPDAIKNKMFNFMTSHKECIPGGVVGQPEDIAKLIAFLADRNSSSYIIGQTIVVDGGSSLIMGMNAHDMKTIMSQ